MSEPSLYYRTCDRRPFLVSYDLDLDCWRIADPAHELPEVFIANDILTSVSTYTFGPQGILRLMIARPAWTGIRLLQINRRLALSQIHEYPPTHHTFVFDLTPDASRDAASCNTERR